MIVVDASAIVKWFFDEPVSDLALRLLGEGKPLAAPDAVTLEVHTAIFRRLNISNAPPEQKRRLCLKWDSLWQGRLFHLHETSPLVTEAWGLAIKYQHKVADCLYIALALNKSLPLATFDRKQAQIAETLGVKNHFSSLMH